MDNNYNYTGYPASYTPNLYYQPTVTTPVYGPRNWQQYNTTTIPLSSSQQQPIQQQQNNNPMVWVQGEAGAKAYVLPPNTTLPLWDSEASVIYIKSVDSSGKPTMTILDYVDRNAQNEQQKNNQGASYATKEQVDALNEQFVAVNKKLEAFDDFVTKEQFDGISHQIETINNRIKNIGKSQTDYNNRKGAK